MSLWFHPLPAMNAAIARNARAEGLPRVLSLCLLTLSAVATPHHAKAAEPAVSNDDWRARSLATIASRRTAILAVDVVDAQGFPVPGAQVSIQQRRSEFRWATGASSPLRTRSPHPRRRASTP